MSRKTRFGVLACALIISAFGAATAAAAPVSLLLPQSNAFSILGSSCGGIQEKAYATGFDATSGYPTGAVYLSTRCGGSGRGGGYHTTTYAAWAGVSWDFTAAVISYGALAAAPAVDPAFSAFYSHGNQVYNQSGSAFLVFAPGFVPAATVTAVAPAAGPASGGTKVTITGTGLTGATGVRFGGAAAASFTVNSSTSITATSPPAGAGTVDVTVTNPGGTSATGGSDTFTFVGVPAVSSLSPTSGPVYGGTEVTITGANLTGATAVSFGGTPTGFVVNNDTSITAFAPAAEATGSLHVTVTSVGGRSARVAVDRFTYTASHPTVTGIDPNVGPGDGGTVVLITGANLANTVEVDFGGVATEFAVIDDSTVIALSPAADPGTVDVTVTTLDGTSAVGAADQFTYVAAPSVSGVDPSTGPPDRGTSVTITGTNLSGATEVDFGGVPADFTVNDDGSITATSPAAAAGTVDLTVTTAGGTSAAAAEDQFTNAP